MIHFQFQLNNKLNYTLAGKTGTAQVFGLDPEEKYIADNIDEKLRDHALFTGFAPIENPKVAIAIIVENAGSGSSKAAPLARDYTMGYTRWKINCGWLECIFCIFFSVVNWMSSHNSNKQIICLFKENGPKSGKIQKKN